MVSQSKNTTAYESMSRKSEGYHIVRRVGHKGTRLSVTSQAEVEKYATGCDGLSPSSITSGTRIQPLNSKNIVNTKDNIKKGITSISNIRIATINVRTLQDDIKLATVVQTARSLCIDVLAMQEVRRTSTGSIVFDDDSLRGWQMVWSGHKRKHEHGVGILLAPHVKIEEYQEHLPARIISATICVKGMRLAILNSYAPTESTKSDAVKAAFYCALNKAKVELDKNPKFKLIALGDLNATISSKSKESGAWDTVLGCNNPDRIETNGNGERLLQWCLKHQMLIMNSMFRSKRIHRETWRHAATGMWKRIDYICTTKWVKRFARSCRVFTKSSDAFDTDHRLLVLDLEFPSTKKELHFQLSRQEMQDPKPRTDFRALKENPDLQQQLTARLENELEGVNTEDIDKINDHIVTIVKESVEVVCPKVNPVKKQEPWEDDELKQQIKDLYACPNHEETRKLQKEIKKRRSHLKNEYYQQMADEINTAAEARDVEKEFSMAKKYVALKAGSRLNISNEKLKDHFKKHFAARNIPLPPELEKPEDFPYLNDEMIPVNEAEPTKEEIKEILKTFKNNKSAGTDLKTEGLKYNHSNNLLNLILCLMTLIWTLVKVPLVWLHCNITCLFKKGLMSVASNYRGLSIGANMSRILAKVIMNRLKDAYEKHISEAQFGFRRNRSTSDGIFITRSIIDKYGGTLIAVYIDLTAAYDHVPRTFLFRVLSLRTGAHHLIGLLQKMYEGTTASIRGTKSNFDVLIGCRQGGQESPCLFNYYFDYVLKVAAKEIDNAYPEGWGIQFEYNIPHWCTNREQRSKGGMRGIHIMRWILYADDVVLFCKTIPEAKNLLTIINDTCNRFGLTISFKKTKTQVFNDKDLGLKETLISIGSHVVENVQQFTYLGQVITNDAAVCFTDHRTARATAKFNELRNVLTDHAVNMRTRRKLLESCIRSRLTYGTQAWYPNEQQMKKLEV